MSKKELSAKQIKSIKELVDHYRNDLHLFTQFLEQIKALLTTSKDLTEIAHYMKWRIKDPSHLESKLIRKAIEAKQKKSEFDITCDNLYEKVNDLIGFRILHLYTNQMEKINSVLLTLFDDNKLPLLEGPKARTWDDESREYFRKIGIETQESPSLYTSVHYIIEANKKTKYTCEIQVRTLMEEVWGEVNHSINYPIESNNISCQEQIKALARLTSGCTRLVDSIFKTYELSK